MTCLESNVVLIKAIPSSADWESYPVEIAHNTLDDTICSYAIDSNTKQDQKQVQSCVVGNSTQSRSRRNAISSKYIAKNLNAMLKGKMVYTDAWYFDYGWIHQLFIESKIIPTFQIESIFQLIPEYQSIKWQGIKDDVTRDMNIDPKSASDNVLVMQESLRFCLDKPLFLRAV